MRNTVSYFDGYTPLANGSHGPALEDVTVAMTSKNISNQVKDLTK